MYQSNLRLGTAKTKSRGEVAGSTKKMYRQKGTGNARAGSRRSGIRRGGGHIFAKRPRDWTYRLPRKAVQLATRMALAAKLRDARGDADRRVEVRRPQDQRHGHGAQGAGPAGNSLLVTTAEHDANVYKSARNIDQVEVAPVSGLNALNLLRPKRVLITKAGARSVSRRPRQAAEGNRPGQDRAAGSQAGESLQACRDSAGASRLKVAARSPPRQKSQGNEWQRPKKPSAAGPASDHHSAAGHREGDAPLDPVQRLRLRGQPDGHQGRRAPAVEELFNVKVVRVHTQNRKGKPRRSVQPRLYQGLEKGDRHAHSEDRIDFF